MGRVAIRQCWKVRLQGRDYPGAGVEELVSYFNTLQPRDSVSLTLVRAGQTFPVIVLLGEWPGSSGRL